MKQSIKQLLTGLTVTLLTICYMQTAYATGEVLSYRFNQNVVISIANVPCPHKEIAKEYPFGAVAKRIDGQFLFGCFKKENDNDIRIQWIQGDTTVIPANYFLQKEIEPTL